jgi:hypothetical protein
MADTEDTPHLQAFPIALVPIVERLRALLTEQFNDHRLTESEYGRATSFLTGVTENWSHLKPEELVDFEQVALNLDPIAATVLRGAVESIRVWIDDHGF